MKTGRLSALQSYKRDVNKCIFICCDSVGALYCIRGGGTFAAQNGLPVRNVAMRVVTPTALISKAFKRACVAVNPNNFTGLIDKSACDSKTT